jgi:hypothetical protein
MRPKKQKLRKVSDEKIEGTKAEVHCFLEEKFIEPIAYPTWLANVIMVQKEKWEMENVHRLNQPQQSLSKGQFSSAMNRRNCRFRNRL